MKIIVRPTPAELGAAAAQEVDGAHEDGLARAGLARDDVEPGAEGDACVFDDGEIRDAYDVDYYSCVLPSRIGN